MQLSVIIIDIITLLLHYMTLLSATVSTAHSSCWPWPLYRACVSMMYWPSYPLFW